MKLKSISSNFDKLKYPELSPRYVTYRDYKYYITDREDSWINELKYLYSESSLHANILNNLNLSIYGSGLLSDNANDNNIIKSLKYDIMLENLIFDFNLYGGAYIFVKWNDVHTKVIEMSYIPFSQIRVGEVNDFMTNIDIYYHCVNWKEYKKFDITPLIPFNVDPNSDVRQIYAINASNFTIYPTPYYNAAIRNIKESIEIDKWYFHLAFTGLGSNKMFIVPGNLSDQEQEELQFILKNNYSGAEGFKNIVFFPENSDFKPEIVAINNEDISVKYQRREEQLRQNIISGHGISSPLLVGEKTAGQLGSGDEYKTALVIYNRKVVYPKRNKILEAIEYINQYNIHPLSKIEIQDVEFQFNEKTLPQNNTNQNV